MPQAQTRSFQSEDLPATRVPIGRGATLPIPARLPTAIGSLSSAIMPPAPPMPYRDIVVVHSSDLHMDHDYTARLHGGDGTAGLACVLRVARAAAADVVVLAGDTFDCHRLPGDLLARAARVISAAAVPVVLLPGNHDPAVADAVYH